MSEPTAELALATAASAFDDAAAGADAAPWGSVHDGATTSKVPVSMSTSATKWPSEVLYQRLSQPPGMLKRKKPFPCVPRVEQTSVTLSPGLYQPSCCELRLASDIRWVFALTVPVPSAFAVAAHAKQCAPPAAIRAAIVRPTIR